MMGPEAHYIEEGKANETELQNAGYVLVAHNEIIQNTVEGGLVELLFLVFFISSLVITVKNYESLVFNKKSIALSSQSKNDSQTLNEFKKLLQELKNERHIFHLAYAGVIAFIAMSLFHFTIQCIPVMTLF
ncbi:MAG: hypothetical protein GZ087_11110 [Flavobacterium sp.]|nr:hypothetical protein [Flavobacterium sp.]